MAVYDKLQRGIIYGPVNSRRLGKSIGINLFPGDKKICSLNCKYCFFQADSEEKLPTNLKSPDDVIKALEDFSQDAKNKDNFEKAHYLTFSGNGEPTIHPQFPEIVKAVSKWNDNYYKKKQLTIFTNSTKLAEKQVADTILDYFNKAFLKFDWGSSREFENIARPIAGIKFNDLVNSIKNFCIEQKKNKVEAIIQTAIYVHQSEPVLQDWEKWSVLMKEFSPYEVHLYNLNFPGKDFKVDDYFDYLDFRRKIYKHFTSKEPTIRFYTPGKFYVNIDLCYAVDSILYLPLYSALWNHLFEKPDVGYPVKVNHFASYFGDEGAIEAIIKEKAQFAICDPIVALNQFKKRKNNNKKQESNTKDEDVEDIWPVLVAVICKKVGLWSVSPYEEKNIEAVLSKVDEVVTYGTESTAYHIKEYYVNKIKDLSTRPKKSQTVQAGEEFKYICSEHREIKEEDRCVISADLMGAIVCSKYCEKSNYFLNNLSEIKGGENFLFTGLISSNKMIKHYPMVVDVVVNGFKTSIEKIQNPSWRKFNLQNFVSHLSEIFEEKGHFYFKECPYLKGNKATVVGSSIDVLVKSNIYPKNCKLSIRALFNAFRIWARDTDLKIPMLSIFKWINFRTVIPLHKIPFAIIVLLLVKLTNTKKKRVFIKYLYIVLLILGAILTYKLSGSNMTLFQALIYIASALILGLILLIITSLFNK